MPSILRHVTQPYGHQSFDSRSSCLLQLHPLSTLKGAGEQPTSPLILTPLHLNMVRPMGMHTGALGEGTHIEPYGGQDC